MPKIHTIENIEIWIFFNDTKKHKAPHFHVSLPDGGAVIDIRAMNPLVSDMKAKKLKKALDWAKDNAGTLKKAWNEYNPHQPMKD